ncbi:cAMP-binding domain of CRP or a regulatory subunit of cAMP-dependent protein kinases [Paenibacillaceae bacterium GAS479]|nr:cAMP-binding domain of CRP or a regulatory subunit of cAMP-dependent protein kinases [Paenibacillaceae bacterium GAS479]
MKFSSEQDRIQRYMSQFNLDGVFSEPDSLPIQLRTYERNELVLIEGDELDGIYFQVEGRTKISSSVGTGKSLLLRYCHPLSIMGDVELFQKVVVQSQVEAAEKTVFLFIDIRTVEAKLLKDYKFLNELLRHLSYKLQTCTTASRINLLASVEERYASYLLTTRLQNEFGKEIQTTKIPEIASLIGTTPRHLNRVIQKLSDVNILNKDNKSITIIDWQRLEKLSHGIRYE